MNRREDIKFEQSNERKVTSRVIVEEENNGMIL